MVLLKSDLASTKWMKCPKGAGYRQSLNSATAPKTAIFITFISILLTFVI
jgi:hypothetical protein